MNWKPTKELMENIISTGVDADILNDLLAEVDSYDRSLPNLVATKMFVRSAISAQISWSETFGSDNDEYIQPNTYMKRSWRPKEETIQLLISDLEYDRVKIGFIRECFKQENQGNLGRAWDCLFVKCAMVYFENETKYNAREVEFETDAADSISETQRIVNKLKIANLTSDIAKEKCISPFFNYSLNESWQPAKWVVNKLLKANINKRFIYDEIILIPFRSHFKHTASTSSDINVEYYRWVIKRFRIMHKLLTKEKEMLEEKLQETRE